VQKGEGRVEVLPLVGEGGELGNVAAEVHECGGADAEEERLPALAGIASGNVELGGGRTAGELGGWRNAGPG
jgi:hypothetical protein